MVVLCGINCIFLLEGKYKIDFLKECCLEKVNFE